MENSYAQALWKMVADGMDVRKAVHGLRDNLTTNGRLALLPRILRAFERLAERELRKNAATITIARESDERHAKAAVKSILVEMEIAGKDLKTQVDDTLIGGWRLEARGRLIDNSYKNQLVELYRKATGTV